MVLLHAHIATMNLSALAKNAKREDTAMSTPAKVVLNKKNGNVSIYLSHDGQPYCILPILASIAKSASEITFNDVAEAYSAWYEGGPSGNASLNQKQDHVWTYYLSDKGELKVTNEHAALSDISSEKSDLFSCIETVMIDYREEALTRIRAALSTLSKQGTNLVTP